MGIALNETPADACFWRVWPDDMPNEIYLSVSGIQKGALWVPGNPPPPLGSFKLIQEGGCSFWKRDEGYTISFIQNLVGSTLEMAIPGGFAAFDFFDPTRTLWAGANGIQQPPARKYFGGFCRLSW